MAVVSYNGSRLRIGSSCVVYDSLVSKVIIGTKIYPTVNMPDGKTWLAVNLDLAWDGLSIPTSGGTTYVEPQAMYYNYDESTYGWNGYKCGLLYNYYAVEYMEANKATLFPGWHVSTDDEWDALEDALGEHAGTKLKAIDGSAGYNWPSGWNGTDTYGFKALPGGYMGSNNQFSDPRYASFWPFDEDDPGVNSRLHYDLYYQWDSIYGSYSGAKKLQRSVRLVKDP